MLDHRAASTAFVCRRAALLQKSRGMCPLLRAHTTATAATEQKYREEMRPTFVSTQTTRYATFKGDLANLRAKALAGGGAKAVRKQHDANKLTARERLEVLLDQGSFLEYDQFVEHRQGPFDSCQSADSCCKNNESAVRQILVAR